MVGMMVMTMEPEEHVVAVCGCNEEDNENEHEWTSVVEHLEHHSKRDHAAPADPEIAGGERDVSQAFPGARIQLCGPRRWRV